MSLNNKPPGFTAEASLKSCKNTKDFTVYSRADYITPPVYSQTISEKITPQITREQCERMPCEECHDLRPCYEECYVWRPAQQECASYFKKCANDYESPGTCSYRSYTNIDDCLHAGGSWCYSYGCYPHTLTTCVTV
jgi:hypothetical protein